jgi:hypothetical protein
MKYKTLIKNKDFYFVFLSNKKHLNRIKNIIYIPVINIRVLPGTQKISVAREIDKDFI